MKIYSQPNVWFIWIVFGDYSKEGLIMAIITTHLTRVPTLKNQYDDFWQTIFNTSMKMINFEKVSRTCFGCKM